MGIRWPDRRRDRVPAPGGSGLSSAMRLSGPRALHRRFQFGRRQRGVRPSRAPCDRPDRLPNRAPATGMAAGADRCPRRHAQAATRSASWSSTCRRCAARLRPHAGSGYGRHRIEDLLRSSEIVRDADRARDRLVRVRDGASAPSADLIAEQPEASSPFVVPTGPSRRTTPRLVPRSSRIGADSMTKRPSGTTTSRAVWYRAHRGRCSMDASIAS